MEFTLKIDCDNAAFEDKNEEVARILRHIAGMVAEGYTSFPQIYDSNGNNVGHAQFQEIQ